ncbi:MAG: DUF2783 domain-containing protein [Alphaproteobacteria bacterium]|nr:DUF2783 domain-containing protein [Alphaproteobacteria bacterium]
MSTEIRTELGFEDPDGIYEALIHLHDGLDPAQSRLVGARLILILANHIGDKAVIEQALEMARGEL